MAALKDPATRARLIQRSKETGFNADISLMHAMGTGETPDYDLAGRNSLARLADAAGRDPVDYYVDRLIETEGRELWNYWAFGGRAREPVGLHEDEALRADAGRRRRPCGHLHRHGFAHLPVERADSPPGRLHAARSHPSHHAGVRRRARSRGPWHRARGRSRRPQRHRLRGPRDRLSVLRERLSPMAEAATSSRAGATQRPWSVDRSSWKTESTRVRGRGR